MNVLDLFSGIGGFALGLERAGMRTVAFCEIDPYCRAVLNKHWPGIKCYKNISSLTAEQLEEDGIGPVDIICGGFPCQDISNAGRREGIEGKRSGLWKEFHRLICEVRPRHVIVENVSALLGRGLSVVLADLAAVGFDAEWHCIPASAVGAPHRRDRVWIIATHTESKRQQESRQLRSLERSERTRGDCVALADADEPRLERRLRAILRERAEQRIAWASGSPTANADSEPAEWIADARLQRDPWRTEPDVGRVAHGVPSRLDRLRALGNAVVPQITEIIGRSIGALEKR